MLKILIISIRFHSLFLLILSMFVIFKNSYYYNIFYLVWIHYFYFVISTSTSGYKLNSTNFISEKIISSFSIWHWFSYTNRRYIVVLWNVLAFYVLITYIYAYYISILSFSFILQLYVVYYFWILISQVFPL